MRLLVAQIVSATILTALVCKSGAADSAICFVVGDRVKVGDEAGLFPAVGALFSFESAKPMFPVAELAKT